MGSAERILLKNLLLLVSLLLLLLFSQSKILCGTVGTYFGFGSSSE